METEITEPGLLLTWGITAGLGWILTILMGVNGFSSMETMYMWTVLMAVPISMTGILYFRGDSNKVFDLWAALVTLLMIENFLAPAGIGLYSYFHLWFLAGAIGFYYTSKRLPPPSEKTYRYGAIASILALPLVFYMPLISPLLAAVVQAGPMMYDWYTVHR